MAWSELLVFKLSHFSAFALCSVLNRPTLPHSLGSLEDTRLMTRTPNALS